MLRGWEAGELFSAGDERWDPDETRRFGQWARRLWDPLLRHIR